MTETFTLAIDAMGGDDAPEMVVAGVSIAAERHPGARFLLLGDEKLLGPLLTRDKRALGACTVRHTPDAISSDLKPTAALRMRRASMRLAIDAVEPLCESGRQHVASDFYRRASSQLLAHARTCFAQASRTKD